MHPQILAPKKKPGRKPKGGRVYSVKLTDAVADYYRRIGGGNLTLGIERAAVITVMQDLEAGGASPAARHE